MIGLLDKETSQLLQMEPNLTMQSAIETCRHRELVRMQNTLSTSADAVTHKNRHGKHNFRANMIKTKSSNQKSVINAVMMPRDRIRQVNVQQEMHVADCAIKMDTSRNAVLRKTRLQLS